MYVCDFIIPVATQRLQNSRAYGSFELESASMLTHGILARTNSGLLFEL